MRDAISSLARVGIALLSGLRQRRRRLGVGCWRWRKRQRRQSWRRFRQLVGRRRRRRWDQRQRRSRIRRGRGNGRQRRQRGRLGQQRHQRRAGGDGGATPCEPGSCGIELVADLSATTLYTPQKIVVDDLHLYFTHALSTKLHRVPKTGGSHELVADLGDDILELAASSTHLYPFLSTGNSVRLLELPKAGGSALELHQIGGSNIDVGSIAPEPGAVYFTSGQNAGGGATAYRWTGTKTELYPAGGFMRATATHLYWNNSGNIRRAAKTVGAPLEQVVSAGTAVDVFEIEGNELVYSYDDRVSLYRVPLTPPFLAIELNPTVVDADFVYDEIAIDASFAYVMADTPDNSTVSTIYRIPRAGGAAVAFIENQPAGRALAQDADYIYWSALYPCGASCGKKLIVRKKK